MKKILAFSFFFIFSISLFSQKITIEEYINTYKDIAMKEMVRSGVPASITLAQGILETDYGNSPLVKKSNNHFGIKCKETWKGPSVSHDDDAPQECFRKYEDPIASYIDHSDFLRTRKHYHFLFDLDPLDYKAWAYGLKKAGYATNPKYPMILIKYIETYNLNNYSLIAMGKKSDIKSELVNTSVPTNKVQVQENDAVEVVAINPGAASALTVDILQKKNTKEELDEVLKAAHAEKSKTAAAKIALENFIEANQKTGGAKALMPNENTLSTNKGSGTYPSGEFKINETRVIYLEKGTSLLSIATLYNIPLKYIYDFNDFHEEKDLLDKSQLIYLQRKRKVGSTDYHVVSQGETLYDIAQKEGIRLDALMQLNHLSSRQTPAAGEKLFLQQQAPSIPALAIADKPIPVLSEVSKQSDDNAEYEVHVVQAKETLYAISKKYNVTVQQLIQWNNLSGNDLKEGMELIISQKDYEVYKNSQ